MSAADPVVKGVHWGYQQGCSFATAKCVDNDVPVNSRLFCTDSTSITCSLDRKSVQNCETELRSSNDFSIVTPVSFRFFLPFPILLLEIKVLGAQEISGSYTTLPSVLSYTTGNNLGLAPEMDYCPHFAVTLSNRISSPHATTCCWCEGTDSAQRFICTDGRNRPRSHRMMLVFTTLLYVYFRK